MLLSYPCLHHQLLSLGILQVVEARGVVTLLLGWVGGEQCFSLPPSLRTRLGMWELGMRVAVCEVKRRVCNNNVNQHMCTTHNYTYTHMYVCCLAYVCVVFFVISMPFWLPSMSSTHAYIAPVVYIGFTGLVVRTTAEKLWAISFFSHAWNLRYV